MARRSSHAELREKDERLSAYLKRAKNSEPFLSEDDVRKMLASGKTETDKRTFRSFRISQPNYLNPVSLALVVVILVAIVLGVQLLSEPHDQTPGESEYSSSVPSQDFRVERTNFQRQQLLNQVTVSSQSEDAKVQLFHKHDTVRLITGRWQYKEMDQKIPTLKVSKGILESIGFEFKEQKVVYEANVDGYGYLNIRASDSSHSLSLGDRPRMNGAKRTTFYPLFVSDMKGKQRVKFRFGKEDSKKMTQEYFNQILDDLVPIAIPNPQKDKDFIAIFWFESTEELFDVLVEEPSKSAHTQSDAEAPAPELEKVKEPKLLVKQNPVFNALDIALTMARSEHVRIDLISVDGEPIKTLVPRTFLEAATHEYSFDLSDMQAGLYLLVATTESQRISKRIIKQ